MKKHTFTLDVNHPLASGLGFACIGGVVYTIEGGKVYCDCYDKHLQKYIQEEVKCVENE